MPSGQGRDQPGGHQQGRPTDLVGPDRRIFFCFPNIPFVSRKQLVIANGGPLPPGAGGRAVGPLTTPVPWAYAAPYDIGFGNGQPGVMGSREGAGPRSGLASLISARAGCEWPYEEICIGASGHSAIYLSQFISQCNCHVAPPQIYSSDSSVGICLGSSEAAVGSSFNTFTAISFSSCSSSFFNDCSTFETCKPKGFHSEVKF